MERTGYIYKITSKTTGKSYIGQTRRSIQQRWWEHLSSASGRESTSEFHKDVVQYGKEDFIVEELGSGTGEQEGLIDKLNELEEEYIEIFDTAKNGYNMTYGGKKNIRVNKLSEEEKEARRKAYYEENKEKISAASKAYYWENREECLEYGKQGRAAHPEECKAYSKKYNDAHKEDRKAYGAERKEHKQALDKAFRERNPNYYKEYRAAHKDEINARAKARREAKKAAQAENVKK